MSNVISKAAIADLVIHPFNPRRTEPNTAEIEALAESIRKLGLMQNLITADTEDGKLGVIGGGRRLRALQLLIKRKDLEPDATVTVAHYKNDVTARAAAVAENAARAPLGPVDEMRAYMDLSAHGAANETIAAAFAVSARYVAQRLALAKLPEEIINALADGDTTLGIAQALTLAPTPETALEVFGQARDEQDVRRMLRTANASRLRVNKINRMGGLTAYEERGGRITRDLFSGDAAIVDDDEAFEEIYRAWEDEAFEAFAKAEGWDRWTRPDFNYDSDFQKLPSIYPERVCDLSEEEADRLDAMLEQVEYGELAEDDPDMLALHARLEVETWTEDQRKVGTAAISIKYDEEVKVFGVKVMPEQLDEAQALGVVQARATPAEKKAQAAKEDPFAAMSASLMQDTRMIPGDVARNALLKQPALALDLMAFQIATTSLSGLAGSVIRGEGATTSGGAVPVDWFDERPNFNGTFEQFVKLPKKDKTAIIAWFVCRNLTSSPSGADAVLRQMERPVRSGWTPDEDYLKRFNAAQLEQIYRECTGREMEVDLPRMKKAGKVAALAKMFAGEAQQSVQAGFDAWLPPQIRPESWLPFSAEPEAEAA